MLIDHAVGKTNKRAIVLVTFGIGLVGAAALTFLGGVLMFAYQLFGLRSGAWRSILVNDFVSEAVRYVLQSPLSLVLVILSLPLFFLGLFVANIGGRDL